MSGVWTGFWAGLGEFFDFSGRFSSLPRVPKGPRLSGPPAAARFLNPVPPAPVPFFRLIKAV